MRIKLISILLTAVIIIGAIPVLTYADGDTALAEKGEFTYTLTSDPDTGTPPLYPGVPDGFGSPDSNGRIWTDKSVSINDDHFDVNLKVLAQEYISSYGSVETHSIAADVVLVLDFTSSMLRYKVPKGNGEVTRMEALIDSVNEAIDIITETNPNNRIQVYYYYGSTSSPTAKCIMPLGHYTSTSATDSTVSKYMVFTNQSSGNTYRANISSSPNLKKDGESFSFSENTGTGTNTQFGIVKGVNGLIDSINAETDKSTERKPYVILLTDGEPTWASKNWDKTDDSSLKSTTVSYTTQAYSSTSTNHNNSIVSALTILSASIMRDRLKQAYVDYNGKDLGVEWFNIGLGVNEEADYTGCLINPAFLKDVSATNANTNGILQSQKVKYYLDPPNEDWGAKTHTEKNYAADYNYVYPNEKDGYVTFADTYEVLNNAFTTLANIIRLGSMEYTVPIVNHEGSGQESSDVEFTDVIGEGMFVTDITLKPNGSAPVQGSDEDGDGVYTFEGYETTVTVTEDANGQQTLVWRLPAREVSMYIFANREDVTNGEYIAADPTVLTYGVDFTNDIEYGPAYTNAFDSNDNPLTTVTYEIPGDNDYYFNVTKDPTTHNFLHSSLKHNLDSETEKSDNITGSAENSHAYEYTAIHDGMSDSSATVNGLLGNNGKATFYSRKNEIDISVEKVWLDKDGDVITDFSQLPEIEVTLYRKADDSIVEETVQVIQLNNSNSFASGPYTLPIRDSNDKRYTYYIKETGKPDNYYIEHISTPLRALDGTLTVTNREYPESGAVLVKKQWQNKIGGEIADTSKLPEVDINLKRHVKILTPIKHKVTILVSDPNTTFTQYQREFYVPHGADISFSLRIYIRSGYNTAKIYLGEDTIASSAKQYNTDYAYNATDPFTNGPSVNINNRWCRETNALQVVENITEDITLNYVSSTAINTRDFPITRNGNVINPYMIRELSMTPPDVTATTATDADDQEYESLSLSFYNDWQQVTGLVLSEPDKTNPEITYAYTYYVEEEDVPDGYTVIYSDNNAAGVTGGIITVTNRSTSPIAPLPTTGGRGIRSSPRIIGISLSAAAVISGFMYMLLPDFRKKRKRAR